LRSAGFELDVQVVDLGLQISDLFVLVAHVVSLDDKVLLAFVELSQDFLVLVILLVSVFL
jgi:hypothetical protein